ncbi:HET-domain-containing protein [Coniochaeta ligniaria NRRL 30616]|uniref:HET-domain-containing protein n=1 Tax=Coniochaeta ligniaria NRRL 30616 TaxID=1408157 RepID=A0A1J7IE12_9PEZI|nr:HET-domain-containing protein [Coniochaeta ligniaria NRRL 30616]
MAAHPVYSKLRSGDDPEIRLLRILHRPDPADWDAPLVCEIDVVRLSDCGTFDALSYVWGPVKETVPILVDNQELAITTSLHTALRQIRYLHQDVVHRLWADGVCINQLDKVEIDHQVPLMGQIYSKTRCVFVWLGEENDDSSLALSMIEKWSKARRELIETGKGVPTSTTILRTVPNPSDPREWTAVERLMDRQWWWRVWTSQEIILSRHAVIICGDSFIRYQKLRDAFGAWVDLGISEKLNQDPSDTFNQMQKQVRAVKENTPSIKIIYNKSNLFGTEMDILQQLSKLRCTNPRDRVYGALGLLVNTPSLEVNYAKSVSQVYHDFSHSIISHTQRLDILEYAGLKTSSHPLHSELPTWVANLDAGKTATRTAALLPSICHASADRAASPIFSEDRKILSATGVAVDRIVDHSSVVFSRDVLNFIFKDFNPQYPTGISTLEALFRLAEGDMDRSRDLQRFSDYSETFVSTSREFILYLIFQVMGSFGTEAQNPKIRELRRPSESFVARMCSLDYRGLADLLVASFYPDEVRRPEILFRSWKEDRLELTTYFSDGLGRFSNHSIFRTSRGYLGLGPKVITDEDIVCVLFGSRVPYVLRRTGSSYQLVGDAYVQGYMDGEAMKLADEGKVFTETFNVL